VRLEKKARRSRRQNARRRATGRKPIPPDTPAPAGPALTVEALADDFLDAKSMPSFKEVAMSLYRAKPPPAPPRIRSAGCPCAHVPLGNRPAGCPLDKAVRRWAAAVRRKRP